MRRAGIISVSISADKTYDIQDTFPGFPLTPVRKELTVPAGGANPGVMDVPFRDSAGKKLMTDHAHEVQTPLAGRSGPVKTRKMVLELGPHFVATLPDRRPRRRQKILRSDAETPPKNTEHAGNDAELDPLPSPMRNADDFGARRSKTGTVGGPDRAQYRAVRSRGHRRAFQGIRAA